MTGVKYEKNKAAQDTILRRVEGYMKRAEDLKNVIDQKASGAGPAKPSGGAGVKDRDKEDEKEDDEKAKLKGQLSSAIVTEKPNVKWDDVAGLAQAKEALKEAVILPRKFPQVPDARPAPRAARQTSKTRERRRAPTLRIQAWCSAESWCGLVRSTSWLMTRRFGALSVSTCASASSTSASSAASTSPPVISAHI